MKRVIAASILAAGLALLATACDSASTPASSTGGISVVAAENFWGSIAAQVGGSKASVRSIIVDPSQDPHSYEPSAQDARTLATAQLAIVNGVGYDPWAPKLIAANPTSGRVVLTVGNLFALKEGDNPHRWYDPAEVTAVANAIASDLKRLDPKDTRVLRPAAPHLRDDRPRAVSPADRADQIPLRGRPCRRLREHLRAAGARARARTSEPRTAS